LIVPELIRTLKSPSNRFFPDTGIDPSGRGETMEIPLSALDSADSLARTEYAVCRHRAVELLFPAFMARANPVSSVVASDSSNILNEVAFRRTLWRATFTLLAALMVPLLISLALVEYLRNSAHWVDHSDRVISEMNRVEKLLVTMQSGFRGYRLMKDPAILAAYTAAKSEFEPNLQRLTELVSDSPLQQERVGQFQNQSRTWIEMAEEALARIHAGQPQESEVTYMLTSRKTINAALASANTLISEEEQLRAVRQKTLDRIVAGLAVLFGVFALAGIPALSFWLQRLLRKVSDSYRASLSLAMRRASELQVTLNSIGDAVIATDAQGRVEFINPAAELLTGWANEEAHAQELGRIFQIYNEETGAIAESPVGRVLRENIVIGLANHTVLRARSGREYPIEDSAAPIRGKNGELLGIILVFREVGIKRETERLLEQSERRLGFLNDLGEATRLLAEPDEIMRISTRMLGSYLRISRCAYADVDLDGDRFTVLEDYTDGCASAAGEYNLALFGSQFAAEVRNGRTLVLRDVEAEIDSHAGGAMFRSIEIRAIVCRPLVKQGRLRALMAVHQTKPRIWTLAEIKLVEDVAERCWSTIERARAEAAVRVTRTQAEEAARGMAEAAERFRLIAGVVSLQVWTAKLNGELDYANQECVQYFGANLDREVLGNAWSQFVHPHDLTVAVDSWLSSVSTGQRYEVEFRLRSRSGTYRWFLVRAVAMRDSQGQIARWFGTNTDIDDLKRAQAEAEQASRAKDDFLAALSHELRTPLTPVLMTAAELREDMRLPVEVREQLGMMERNIALEARLIDDLLDLTSIARGKLHLRATPCDAHSLIGLALEIVRADAHAKGISIECNFTAHHSGLMVDPSRFQQVIWNLLRNAVKFTPPGGIITINTSEKNGAEGIAWLQIVVTDSGIGIEPDMLEKIFRPFDQGGLTGDHRFGGVGLGLAIARAVIDLHGGRISAQSEGSNRGATFIVEFPGATRPPHGVADPTQLSLPIMSAGSIPPIPLPSASTKAALRLLLVEDHEATLQVLLRLLAREGHHVVRARGVAEALAAAAVNTFDLVISDLGLPDGTGTELMQKLRAAHGLRGIALSGYGMEEDIARSREAGFFIHLIKPVDFPQLKRALDTSS
jgi:PAS domain S-box-containing protein